MAEETRKETTTKSPAQHRKAFVVINPRSQKSQKVLRKLRKDLQKMEIKAFELVTQEPYHAAKIIAEIAKEPHPVFIVSGDGTLFEITNGLAKTESAHPQMHIVPIPGGGANDFALSVLPRGLASARKALLEKTEAVRIDILRLEIFSPNGKKMEYLVNGYLGFGSTAKGSRIINKKRPRNRISELSALGSVISDPFAVAFEGRNEKLISLTIHNIPRMARYIKIKNADPFDGQFEVVAVKPGQIFKILTASVFLGTKGISREKIEIAFPENDVWCQADGEVLPKIYAGSKIRISVLRKSLPILRYPH